MSISLSERFLRFEKIRPPASLPDPMFKPSSKSTIPVTRLGSRYLRVLKSSTRLPNVRIYRRANLHNASWDVLYYRMRAIFDAFKSEHYPEPPLPDSKKDGKTLFDCGKRVTGILDTDATVTVEYEDLMNGGDGSISADLVLVAGGASCNIRSLLLPESDLQRPYSGYLTWRGTVPESDVSEETKRSLGQENTVYIGTQSYVVM